MIPSPALPHPHGFDRSVLDRLLALAGPAEAGALLAQLVADLAAVERQLTAALPAGDWAAIRAASHALTALAGTIGAAPLSEAARALGGLARGEDAGGVARQGPGVLAGLGALRRHIALPSPVYTGGTTA